MTSVSERLQQVRRHLHTHGWGHLSADATVVPSQEYFAEVVTAIGEPIHVFSRFPIWKPIILDESRPLGRSGGYGFNSLHVDCVNMESPPDFVVFRCVRPDLPGFGASLVCPTTPALQQLSAQSRAVLSTLRVSEGKSEALNHVGHALSKFSVVDRNWGLRYTGRLLEADLFVGDERSALLELDRLVNVLSVRIELAEHDILIIDQRTVLHGRCPVSVQQHGKPDAERRLIEQIFLRERSNHDDQR